jgi:predicted RNA-binding protein Jag
MAEAQWQRGKEWLERALALMGIPVAVKAPSAELVAACDAEAQWLVIDETALTQQQLESLLGADGAPLGFCIARCY